MPVVYILAKFLFHTKKYKKVITPAIMNQYHLLNIVVVALLFYVHGKHLRSCRDGQLT